MSEWNTCKNCGRRYPARDGAGPYREFCGERCLEESKERAERKQQKWEREHPRTTAFIGWLNRLFITALIIAAIVSYFSSKSKDSKSNDSKKTEQIQEK